MIYLNKGKTNEALDFAKFVAAIMVVAIHTNTFKDINIGLYNFCTYCIFTFAVPFFFICGGYLLGEKIRCSTSVTEYKCFIKHYALRLLYPYLIWGVWYFIITCALNIIRKYNTPIDTIVHQLKLWIVSSPGGGLWYIQSVLILLLILYIDGNKRHISIYTIIGVLFTFVPGLCAQLKDKVYFLDRIQTAYYKVFLTELNFLWWGAYFLLGLTLSIRGRKIVEIIGKHRIQYLAISYGAYIIVYIMSGKTVILQSLKLLVSIIMFIAIMYSHLPINSVISVNLRKMSTIIYFSHFTFIYIIQIVFKLLDLDYGTHLTLAWVVCCFAVVFYSFVLVYTKDNPLMQLYERKKAK